MRFADCSGGGFCSVAGTAIGSSVIGSRRGSDGGGEERRGGVHLRF
jgi:hypothetical protein